MGVRGNRDLPPPQDRTGWDAPQNYTAEFRPTDFQLLGNDRWVVLMNNCDLKSTHASQAAAEREAARRNYTEGCYAYPQMIGL